MHNEKWGYLELYNQSNNKLQTAVLHFHVFKRRKKSLMKGYTECV